MEGLLEDAHHQLLQGVGGRRRENRGQSPQRALGEPPVWPILQPCPQLLYHCRIEGMMTSLIPSMLYMYMRERVWEMYTQPVLCLLEVHTTLCIPKWRGTSSTCIHICFKFQNCRYVCLWKCSWICCNKFVLLHTATDLILSPCLHTCKPYVVWYALQIL